MAIPSHSAGGEVRLRRALGQPAGAHLRLRLRQAPQGQPIAEAARLLPPKSCTFDWRGNGPMTHGGLNPSGETRILGTIFTLRNRRRIG